MNSRIRINARKFAVVIILLFTLAINWINIPSNQDAIVTGSVEISQDEQVKTNPTEYSTTTLDSHTCTGKNDPGFVCPNAKPLEYAEGKQAVLQEKCKACPKQKQNGGACPGKNTYA